MKVKSYHKVTEGEVEHGFRFVCKMSRLEDIFQRAPSSIVPDNKGHCSCWVGNRILKNPLRFLPLFGNAVYLYAESPDHWKIVAKRPSTYKADLELARLCLEFWNQARKCDKQELWTGAECDLAVATHDQKIKAQRKAMTLSRRLRTEFGFDPLSGDYCQPLPVVTKTDPTSIEGGYRRMRTEDLIALLQQHPGKQVLIEDNEECLEAYAQLCVQLGESPKYGQVVLLSALISNPSIKFNYLKGTE